MSDNKLWSKQFSGIASDYIKQAKARGMTARSITYWVKFNWNIRSK